MSVPEQGGSASAGPRIDYDPFSAGAMRDPYALYGELRAQQPVYELPQYEAFAISRFEDVWRVIGDAVVIRSGADAYLAGRGEVQGFGSPVGVHASACEFLFESEASLLCWDFQDAPTADQGIPNPLDIHVPLHVHHILLPYMGMPIIDNADFEALAAACAELGRWEFQLVVAPLLLEGGTGSPVNPIAVL